MDRFVVGPGRCGSTLLSQMLGLSPELLSIFEFFNGLDMTRRFDPEPVSGVDFAFRLAIRLATQALDSGVRSLDELYLDPGPAPDARPAGSRSGRKRLEEACRPGMLRIGRGGGA